MSMLKGQFFDDASFTNHVIINYRWKINNKQQAEIIKHMEGKAWIINEKNNQLS